jgi:hypothetical protein
MAEKIIIETIKRVAKPNPKRSRTVFTTGCKELSIDFKKGRYSALPI